MTRPTPFSVAIPQDTLDDIRRRVEQFPWNAMHDAGSWDAGPSVEYMRSLSRYWIEEFDWRSAETRLNTLPQFQTVIDGVRMHYVHIRGSGDRSRALFLCHGWPGSCFEFIKVIEKLAHPERFGGRAEDAFDVIAPSIPGFGFAGPPPRPTGSRGSAARLHKLMTDVLGYSGYIAQGGDWGAHISTWLGHDYPEACRGVHLNMIVPLSPGMPAPESTAERQWSEAFFARFETEKAYFLEQGTKPQSLAYAMMDSPIGVAAWLVEKFASWSDLPYDAQGTPDLGHAYTRDELLTNIMIYLVSQSFATSTWIYRGFYQDKPAEQYDANRSRVPTGVAAFPDPMFGPPPRSLAERAYNIVHWTDMPRGGHFAAMEAPDLFVDDVRAFAKVLSDYAP